MTKSALKVTAYKHYYKDGVPKTICQLSNGKMAHATGHIKPPFVVQSYKGREGQTLYGLDNWVKVE